MSLFHLPLAVSIFGFDIPIWIIVVVILLLYLFRGEVKALLSLLLRKLGIKQERGDEEMRRLAMYALEQYNIGANDIQSLDGQRLIQLLKAFVAFTKALSSVTPSKVDDVVVLVVEKIAAFLEGEPALAQTIANVLSRLFSVRKE